MAKKRRSTNLASAPSVKGRENRGRDDLAARSRAKPSKNVDGRSLRRSRGVIAEQKQKTRSQLVAAGRLLATEGNFLGLTIDDIANSAGLSRAAYYLHFKNKEDLLHAVLNENMDVVWQYYRTVSPRAVASHAGVIDWFKQFVERFRENRQLIALYYTISPLTELNRDFHFRRCAAVEILGHRLPQLQVFTADGSVDEVRHMDVLLFIYQLEQVTYAIANCEDAINSELALDRLAERMFFLMKRRRVR